MGIVDEVIVACKDVLDTLLVGYVRSPYEFDTELNSERDQEKRYGFIPAEATFAEGRAMGFTTMNHSFELKLIDCYQPEDSDAALSTKLMAQYALMQDTLKDLQKSRLQLPTPDNRIKLISGLAMEAPLVDGENKTVELKGVFNIQYSYRNV